MFKKKNIFKESFDLEYAKQLKPYEFYLAEIADNDMVDKGEHENVPFICIEKEEACKSEEERLENRRTCPNFVSETEDHIVYEYGEYILYENKKGFSTAAEREKLITCAEKLNSDLIYADCDHITNDGRRHTPFYKPCFGTDTFVCFDYISDLFAVKKNKSRMSFELMEIISHVPEVLFHYVCDEMGVIDDYAREINTTCYKNDMFYIDSFQSDGSKDCISIIIPSKDNPSLIETCLDGIKNSKIKSGINRLEVTVVDNGSGTENKDKITTVIDGIRVMEPGLSIKYIYEPSEFNFSAMCNRGVEESHGEYLLFLNDDIEISDELFLLKMLYFAKMEHVGAVGCKLLYPGEERRIQHVGITALKFAGPSHKLSTFPDDRRYYFGRNEGVHNCLAVTGAALMVSAQKYFKTGGFYDKMKVGYNDVDLCVSLYESGYENLVNNECVLIHHESVTRGSDAASITKLKRLDDERNLLYERHSWLLTDGDPYYNVNLAEDFLDYRVNVIPDFERRDYESRQLSTDDSKNAKNTAMFIYKAEKRAADKAVKAASKNMFFNIDSVVRNRDYADIYGWALMNKAENYMFDAYIVVNASENVKALPKKPKDIAKSMAAVKVYSCADMYRSDLSSVFPEAGHCELSGIFARIPADGILDEEGRLTAQLSVLLVNKKTGKRYYAG